MDCSGDGDAAARAGVPFRLGRMPDSACQPMTLMSEIDGRGDWVQTKAEHLHDQLSESIRRQNLSVTLPTGRVNFAPWIINVPRPGAATDGRSPEQLDGPSLRRALEAKGVGLG